MKHPQVFLLLVFGSVLLFGCKDSSTNSAAGGSNTIKGIVTLYDTLYDDAMQGIAIVPDAAGITVSLEGTSYNTLTNAKGEWEIPGVPAGIYKSLMFLKQGIAPYKRYHAPMLAFPVEGGATQYESSVDLFRISYASVGLVIRPFERYTEYSYRDTLIYPDPTNPDTYYQTTVVDSEHIDHGKATFTCRILDQPEKGIYRYNVGLYFNSNPNIVPLDPYSYLFYPDQTRNNAMMYIGAGSGKADIGVIRDELLKAGFTSGQTIYCVAYCFKKILNSGSYGDYLDPATNVVIHPSFSPNHSEVVSFVLP